MSQQLMPTLRHHASCTACLDRCYSFMQAFKDGDIRFLICTDVAARGIDISGLPYLINMTLPDRTEDYIHRVGRVGQLLAHAANPSWAELL